MRGLDERDKGTLHFRMEPFCSIISVVELDESVEEGCVERRELAGQPLLSQVERLGASRTGAHDHGNAHGRSLVPKPCWPSDSPGESSQPSSPSCAS